MDYIPILEIACFVIAGFVIAGTLRGLRNGEVHFPVRLLFEQGYKREHPKFGAIVASNFALAGILIGIAVFHLFTLNSGLPR